VSVTLKETFPPPPPAAAPPPLAMFELNRTIYYNDGLVRSSDGAPARPVLISRIYNANFYLFIYF
jgi:hypothetical protein